jgi:hypothetical protein
MGGGAGGACLLQLLCAWVGWEGSGSKRPGPTDEEGRRRHPCPPAVAAVMPAKDLAAAAIMASIEGRWLADSLLPRKKAASCAALTLPVCSCSVWQGKGKGGAGGGASAGPLLQAAAGG